MSSATSDGDEAEAEVEVVVEDDEGEYKEDVEDDEENDVDDEGHIVKKRRKVEGKDSVLQTKGTLMQRFLRVAQGGMRHLVTESILRS